MLMITEMIPLETKEDVTYKVGVFGSGRYDPFRDDYLQDIHIQNASSGTATLDGCSGWHLLCI